MGNKSLRQARKAKDRRKIMKNNRLELKYAIIKKDYEEVGNDNSDGFRFEEKVSLDKALKDSNLKINDKYVRLKVDSQNYHIFYEKGNLLHYNEASFLEPFSKVKYYTFYLNSYSNKVKSKVLSKLRETLYSQISDEYYLIKVSDSVSIYYIEKMTPYILRYEAILREIIYVYLLKKYESEWYEVIKSSPESNKLINRLERKNKRKLIENGLQELSLGNIEKAIYSDNATAAELISLNEMMTMKRILERDMENIRNVRNVMFHLKDFYESDFIEAEIEIDNLIYKLNECKKDIIKTDRRESLNEILSRVSDLTASIGAFASGLAYNMSNFGKEISDYISDIISEDTIENNKKKLIDENPIKKD